MSEPLHHAGTWWARTTDGAVLRYNEELDGWEPWTPHSVGPMPPSQWRELIGQPVEAAAAPQQDAPPPPPPPAAEESSEAAGEVASNVSPLRRDSGVHDVRADLIAGTIVTPGDEFLPANPGPDHPPAPEASAAAPERPSKTCPACAEVIGEEALICRFCGYDFVAGTFPQDRTGFAVAGFTFGVVGFLLPLIGAVFALTFGYLGRAQPETVPHKRIDRLANVAVILGWAQILVGAIAVSLWRYLQ